MWENRHSRFANALEAERDTIEGPLMLSTLQKPRSCEELLAEYRQTVPTPDLSLAKALDFHGAGERDVYNITAPFEWLGETFILGRVEPRDSESAQTWFFRRNGDAWEPAEEIPVFDHMQDPCVTFVDGELILGGVTFPVPLSDGTTGWRMEFYRAKTLNDFRLFFTGPDKMKDIRLKQLPDGRIGVFTRPQGAKGGRGKIGFVIAANLESLTAELLDEAPLFEHFFLESEWGGANEAHVLANGHLGVLGHVACFDGQDHRHYYAMAFSVNPETGEASDIRIIGERRDFPPGPTKRADLVNVIFSGGIVRGSDGRATLYAGLSDASAACTDIADPWAN